MKPTPTNPRVKYWDTPGGDPRVAVLIPLFIQTHKGGK
jgi:hypothetical protein